MTSKFYDLTVIKTGDREVAKVTTDLDLSAVDVAAARLRRVLLEAVRRDRGDQETWAYSLQVRDRDRPALLFTYVDSTVTAL